MHVTASWNGLEPRSTLETRVQTLVGTGGCVHNGDRSKGRILVTDRSRWIVELYAQRDQILSLIVPASAFDKHPFWNQTSLLSACTHPNIQLKSSNWLSKHNTTMWVLKGREPIHHSDVTRYNCYITRPRVAASLMHVITRPATTAKEVWIHLDLGGAEGKEKNGISTLAKAVSVQYQRHKQVSCEYACWSHKIGLTAISYVTRQDVLAFVCVFHTASN